MTPEELALACLAGEIRPLQAAVKLARIFDPWHPMWEATNGTAGPLVALHMADDEASKLGYIGDDPSWWHSSVAEEKREKLAEAESRFSPSIFEACRSIVSHSASRNSD